MHFVYVAQSRMLSKNMQQIGLQGFLVKIGHTYDMDVRLTGLRGLLDDGIKDRYEGQVDWQMWRCRFVSGRTKDWWCDPLGVEKAIHEKLHYYNILNRNDASEWVREQEWFKGYRQELFILPDEAKLLELFPYRASYYINARTIESLEPIPPRIPRDQRYPYLHR